MPANGAAGTVTGSQGNLVPNSLLAGVPLVDAAQHAAAAAATQRLPRTRSWEFRKHGCGCRARDRADRTVARSAADPGDALTTGRTRERWSRDKKMLQAADRRHGARRRRDRRRSSARKLVDIQVVRADDLQTRVGERQEVVAARCYGTAATSSTPSGTVMATTIYTLHGRSCRRPTRSPAAETRWSRRPAKIGAITGQGGDAVVALIDDALKADPKSKYALIKSGMDVADLRQARQAPISRG